MRKINNKINIGAKEIKQIKMTAEEKKFMLSNILNSSTLSDIPVKSPWSFNTFITNLQKNRFAYYGSMSCFVIIFGSGIIFASQKSLPGNILYPLKVKIVEPIYSNLILSKELKAKYESSLATERMIEAENLANQNKLDDIKEKQLNDLLIDHTETLSKTLSNLPQDEPSENKVKDDIVTDFQNQMNTHADNLDEIHEPNTIQRENNENNIEVKEAPQQKSEDTVQLSETARESANKIRDELENEKQQSSEKYENNIEEPKQDTLFIKETTSKTENSENEQNRETQQDTQETRETDD